MTSESWQRIKTIVTDARQVLAEDRAAFVAKTCAGDLTIEREVLSLLSAMDEAGDLFEAPIVGGPTGRAALNAVLQQITPADPAAAIGRRIGPYEIRRELGAGGMGAVYLASRADDEFNQDVALKIIKRGMDTDAIVRRFRSERQILATLNHPNIARLLDGGSTADGLPYLVLEYVDGEPITTFCDRGRLTISQRIQLFCRVCDAVAYAHQHLVVHRDIKPSNVLVTADGVPKLLDFGLATIFSTAEGQDAQTVQRWMTPEFASPEQILGQHVTTASDTYSLGVLLYTILCGHRPYRGRDGVQDSAREGNVPPPRPSTALTTTPTRDPAEIGALRGTTVERLRRALRGDLDNIVMKALAVEPSRRYGVANDLAEDLRRHLSNLPVSARRDTLAYHTARFLRRHTAASAAVALVAATLAGASIVTAAQAREARRERAAAERRFREVRQLATRFLFDFHDSIESLPGSTAARAMVVTTAQQYLDSLAEDAGVDHDLLSELSTAYVKLADVQGRPSASRIGDTDAALVNYGHAIDLRRRLVALEPLNTEYQHNLAIALVRMGPIYQVRGDPARAAERTREAMPILDALLARAPDAEIRRDAFRAPLYLGDALSDIGDYAGALEMYRKALGIARLARLDPPEADYRHRLAVISERLGFVSMRDAQYAAALANYREALAQEQAMSAAEPENAGYRRLAANGYYHVADALRALKQYADALAAARQGLRGYEDLARADPLNAGSKKDLGGSTHEIAEILLASGDRAAAQSAAERALAIRRELAAKDTGSAEYQDDVADTLMLLGEVQLARHDPAAALANLRQALAIRSPLVASRPDQVGYSRGLAQLCSDIGDAELATGGSRPAGEHLTEARRAYTRALALWTQLDGRKALWADERRKPVEIARKLSAISAPDASSR